MPLPRADLDPRAEMGLSVGCSSLLIELFWPKLCSNGSRRGWIRLWLAGLNWHFGTETGLFNLHRVFLSVRLKTHRATFDCHPDRLHSHFTKSLLKELLSRAIGFSNRLGFLTVRCILHQKHQFTSPLNIWRLKKFFKNVLLCFMYCCHCHC